MKNFTIIKQILTILFLSLSINSFSQINDISMENIQYLGNSITECSTINFNSSNSHSISFDVRLQVEDTPNGFVYTEGVLEIAYYTGSAQEIYQTIVVDANDWTYDTVNTNANLNIPTINMQLNNNDFDAGDTEGGRIYLIYTETNNGGIIEDSCDVDITKPRFTLTPNSASVTCDSNSSRTFTVNNENNSPGVQEYQWNVGNGWLYNGSSVSSFTTTDDNVQLTPTLFPPDNVTVTPKLDGVSFPVLTSNITLGDFISTNVITGGDAVCSTENFNVFGLSSGTSVTNWNINNTNIASISSNGNQVTVTPTGNGVISIIATLTNSCGQTFDIFKNNIAVGSPAITNYSINGGNDNVSVNSTSQLNVDFVPGATSYYWFITVQNSNCSSGGVLPSFQTGNGNASTLTSTSRYAFIDWGTCTGNFIVNCRALNDCGASDIGNKQVTVFDSSNNPCPQEPVGGRQAQVGKSKTNTMKMYPNPYNGGTIHFKLPPALPCNDVNGNRTSNNNIVNIFDFKGRKLFAKAFNTNEISIKSLDLKKGQYIIKVYTSNGDVFNSKLLVE